MIIRRGARGEGVRDLQARLLALGEQITVDERGVFGPSTEAAVRAFQERRGLEVDGIVGPETWRDLVEASWQMGDRTLYLRTPFLRGDDVRALQERLSSLGFHGRSIDGIFGPDTEAALKEFQGNYGLPPDGIFGDATVQALAGLPALGGGTPVAAIREQLALRRLPPTLAGLRLALDPGHGGDDPGHVGPAGAREEAAAFALARALEATLAASGAEVFLTREDATNPSASERAALAGRVGADLFVSVHTSGAEDPAVRGGSVSYFGHERFHSQAGRRLAELAARALEGVPGLARPALRARTFAVLRETPMPAVQIQPATITNPEEEAVLSDPATATAVAEALAAALRRFAAETAEAAAR